MGLGRPGGGGAGHRAARLPSRRLEARIQQGRPLAAGYPDLPGEACGPVDCCSRCRAAPRVRAEPTPASATSHARPTGVHPMALTRSDYCLSQLDVLEAESIHVMREVVASVQESIDAGRVAEETGRWASRNRLQTVTLLDAIEENRFDAVFGGARRDEEKARAKERMFSFRDEFGQWDPKNQRPELWALYNGRVHQGESIRVFPLSNWTELDVWQYIAQEGIGLPSIYFAHERECFMRDGMIMAVTEYSRPRDGDQVFT